MKSKISFIIAICSIPLILIIVIPQTNIDCTGNAMCLKGKITGIFDGDTILVDDTEIRLALISIPEPEFSEAKEFVEKRCPVGSDVLVDEDDGQIESSLDRIFGKVFCKGIMLNEEILKEGIGEISTLQCSKSEFKDESWAKNYGC